VAAVGILLTLFPMKMTASVTVRETVRPYVQLQQQIHEALRKEHPEWVEPNGDCPMCEAYESRLAELLALSSATEHRSAA
jgi:hypothetical protein